MKHLEILVVADFPGDFRIYSRLLRGIPNFNYVCTRAENGGHALASLGNRHFDCILLDYSLPDIDGVTLLNKIRIDLPTLPVIILTGQARDDIAVAALKAGANNYIDKLDVSGTRLHDVITVAIAQCEAAQAETKPPLSFLLIDDSADDRETYIRLLRQTRYRSARCVEAASAKG